jgi:hypothetical protein
MALYVLITGKNTIFHKETLGDFLTTDIPQYLKLACYFILNMLT